MVTLMLFLKPHRILGRKVREFFMFKSDSSLVKETNETVESIICIIQKALTGVETIIVTNNAPPNIPLQERDDQLKKVAAIVGSNLNKMSGPQAAQGAITGKAKTDLVIPVIAGGSGTGKVIVFVHTSL